MPSPADLHEPPSVAPYAAVCIAGELRAMGDNATQHWAQQREFYKSLMLGEAWAGLHMILVSNSEGKRAMARVGNATDTHCVDCVCRTSEDPSAPARHVGLAGSKPTRDPAAHQPCGISSCPLPGPGERSAASRLQRFRAAAVQWQCLQ